MIKSKKASGILIIVIGIIMCLIVFGNQMKYKAFVAKAQQTSGHVTDVDKRTTRTRTGSGTRRRRTKYTAYVKYTVDGIDYNMSFSTGASSLSTGSTVTIYYDPANPSKAYSDVQMNGSHNFAFVLIIILGAYQYIRGKKEENNSYDV